MKNKKKTNLSLCEKCYCMTKTINNKCGKCGKVKSLDKKKTNKQQSWEKDLLGFNDRGIVTYSDGLASDRYSNPVAVCNNCGAVVKGEKAKKWIFGHINCPKPNGWYIRNDITVEKLRSVISQEIQKAKDKRSKEILGLDIMEDEGWTPINCLKGEKATPEDIEVDIRNEFREELKQKIMEGK